MRILIGLCFVKTKILPSEYLFSDCVVKWLRFIKGLPEWRQIVLVELGVSVSGLFCISLFTLSRFMGIFLLTTEIDRGESQYAITLLIISGYE